MINVSKARAQIDAAPGQILAVPKFQLIELLAEVELGQHARRALTRSPSVHGVSNSTVGLSV